MDLLERSASGKGVVHFLSSDGMTAQREAFSRLWSAAGPAGDWLVRTVGKAGSVGALLTASPACVITILAAWRRGLTLVSLPAPARAVSILDYQAQIEAMCALAGAKHAFVDAQHLPLISSSSVTIHPFEACLMSGSAAGADEPGDLIQFTSGSTSQPKGVRLTLDAMAKNVTAIVEAFAPGPGEVVCSWLPLSHDMGFIGVLLCSVVASAPEFGGDTQLVLMKPEQFLANPTIWLRACSHFRATLSAVPNFGLDLAARTLERAGVLDLSSFRVIYIGGERVKAESLRRFQAATEHTGFRPRALCPAYGMAEATLAISVVRPEESWHSVHVDRDQLAGLNWTLTASGGAELVSNGRTLRGVRCRVASGTPGSLGELTVSSPSLLSGYVGGGRVPADGWLRTGDLGYIDGEGQVYVVSRNDDVIVSHGRNLYGPHLSSSAERVAGVRPGSCVAVPTDDGTYAIVAELRGSQHSDPARQASEIRAVLARSFGAAPSAVVFIKRGALPKTPSGKPQVFRVRALLESGQLEVEKRFHFGGR